MMGCSTSISKGTSQNTERWRSLIKNESFISNENKEFVKRTWRIISSDIQEVGAKIFISIFDINPLVKEIFQCDTLEGDALLKNKRFRGHATRFMQAIGVTVDNIDDLHGVVGPMLEDLGRQHHTFDRFKPGYWDCFTEAILQVWKDQMRYRFTAEVESAWKTLFAFIILKLKDGYQQACLLDAKDSVIYP